MTESGRGGLSCTVGLVTYKRPDILMECLRCLLAQTRLPQEIIVADASPDAAQTRARVDREVPGLVDRIRLEYVQTETGISRQRNFILDHARSDIIVFLDDDALAAPEYVERLMAVYEGDVAGQVGGVEGLALEGEAAASPAAGSPPVRSASDGPARSLALRAGAKIARLPESSVRFALRLLDRLALPYFPEEVMRPVHGVPEALRHLQVVPVRSLYGCVMSFRLPLARTYRFDENLALYSYMEDFELSYRIGKQYALLRCLNAPARHVRIQGGRLHPSVVTYLCLVNVAYIGRRVMDWTPALQHHLERYARRSVHLELVRGCFRKTGFSHYRGARAGLKDVLEIVRAPGSEVPQLYTRAAQEGLRHGAY